jgi:hypothetical protein
MTDQSVSRATAAMAGALAAEPGSESAGQFLAIVTACFREVEATMSLPEFLRRASRGLAPLLAPTPELVERIAASTDEGEIERLLRDDWLLDSLHNASRRVLD